MNIRLLRNATLLVEASGGTILVDPMLGPRGSLSPFVFLRGRIRSNPLVELPPGSTGWLATVTHAMVTHRHADHLDPSGAAMMREREIPVFCGEQDAPQLRRRGLRVEPVSAGAPRTILGGTVEVFPAIHGCGMVAKAMGRGHGFLLNLPGEPAVYLTGDTVLTADVKAVVQQRRPEIVVVHAGAARLDLGAPILMPLDEVIELVRLATGRVLAVHLDALDHCETTRASLRARLAAEGLVDRVDIPADGEATQYQS